jgi:hypothetical protein
MVRGRGETRRTLGREPWGAQGTAVGGGARPQGGKPSGEGSTAGVRGRARGSPGHGAHGASRGSVGGARRGSRGRTGKKKGEGEGERERDRGRGKGSSPQRSNFVDNRHQDLRHNGEEREMGERGSCVLEN